MLEITQEIEFYSEIETIEFTYWLKKARFSERFIERFESLLFEMFNDGMKPQEAKQALKERL